ncbi:MAG TPA: LLM class flavin-dependent oxidoreductase [Thermomicrobiales bacterium]|nr:LLM class flavin-dependent oxidoreductase [Thermomicrobiales bacterium]
MSRPAIGLMFFRTYPPETLPDYARMVEQTGLDDLWVVEDCFFNGGISAASVALAVTERITVGIGILPAVVRNAAYAAMDLATLARIFPGRLHVGFGHGVADWIRQVGQMPASQMAALEEVTVAVRDILHGQTVTMSGKHVHLDNVRLDHPPTVAPPVSLGVTGPKSLALSGRIADGTILVELTGPALLCRNREIIDGGADHQLTVFAYWSQDADGAAARDRLRRMLAERIRNEGLKELEAPGFADQARALLDRGGVELLAREMPDAWLDEITVSGTPEQCLAAIDRLGAAGATRVVLVPPSNATIPDLTPWCRDLAAVVR